MYFDQELDTRNLKCFVLTLNTKKILNAISHRRRPRRGG